MRRCAFLLVPLALLALGIPASAGLADGDPASDVLLGEDVFYPYNPPVSASLQKTLNGETAAANQAHFPIKVALIDSPIDLGAVPNLFDKPQQYADFLDQEISFQTRQPLLVVMPNGYGVSGLPQPSTLAAASLPKPTSKRIDDLARAASVAIARLAAAAGHPVKNTTETSTTHSDNSSPALTIAILTLAAFTTAAAVTALRRRRAPNR
jgi:hypothetical protein